MCYNAILPITIKSKKADALLFRLTCIFNRWRKMIKNYGKLDCTSLTDDFNLISMVIKSCDMKNSVRSAVRTCRDIALSSDPSLPDLYSSLSRTLRILCEEQEDSSIKTIKKIYDDQGMTERYRPLSKRLRKEKIRRLGKEIIFTDINSDRPATTRLVRRIIEKRAAQTVFKNSGRSGHDSNRFRQSVRRAASFSLYNTSFIDYDREKRFNATHWKVIHYASKGTKALKAKRSYNTQEDALNAIENHYRNHPGDPRPMEAYLCAYCGKWHIGHVS
ncbi:MAG: hypothetical protein K2J82_09910 [Muribaculaceae bacterium]|nr:hypothetical protein [Muribaculaceae bacterium]MDE6754908.1 hypothetical protein [Muribaculaceae bacterium]